MNKQIIRAYSIQDVSKRIEVPTGTIRQWEKDLKGLLVIPRSKQGSRFYTEKEIELLQKIKEMRAKNLSKDMIRMLLEKNAAGMQEESAETMENALAPAAAGNPVQVQSGPPLSAADFEKFYTALETYKHDLLVDIKQTIQLSRENMVAEIKEDFSHKSLETVQRISKSIQRANEKRKLEMEQLAETVHNTSELASETFGSLSDSITKASEDTYERLSKRMARTTKDTLNTMNKAAVNVKEAHREIKYVSEAFQGEQEHFIETMTENLRELTTSIKDREEAFQEMVASFRNAAAAKDKKSWRKWFAPKPSKS